MDFSFNYSNVPTNASRLELKGKKTFLEQLEPTILLALFTDMKILYHTRILCSVKNANHDGTVTRGSKKLFSASPSFQQVISFMFLEDARFRIVNTLFLAIFYSKI